jgi:hypothetical protein
MFTFVVLSRVVLALAAGAEATFGSVEPCTSVTDVLTGCGSTFTSILTSLVLGTIPGPDWTWLALLNAVLLVLVNGRVVFAIIKLVRGVPDL